MATCDVCGREESMPYRCRYCGGTYCGEHRLPENHDCTGLSNWGDPGGVFDSGFDSSTGRQEASLSDRIFGRGGLAAYFREPTYVILALMWLTFLAQLLVGFGSPLHNRLFVLQTTAILDVWTWVTSVFAHGGLGHIAINSIVLYFFGPPVQRRLGARKFVALFLGAGILAGLAQVGLSGLLGGTSAVVGASGGIAAIMGVLTVLNPNLRIYLYFVIPMPLWVATLLFAGYSAFVSVVGGIGAGGVAQIAHLAGLGIGLLYGAYLKDQGQTAPQQLQFGSGGGGGFNRRF